MIRVNNRHVYGSHIAVSNCSNLVIPPFERPPAGSESQTGFRLVRLGGASIPAVGPLGVGAIALLLACMGAARIARRGA